MGFGLGVYFLPIIVADAPVDQQVIKAAAAQASYKAEFTRDLPGSDFAHWGEGTLYLSPGQVSLMVRSHRDRLPALSDTEICRNRS